MKKICESGVVEAIAAIHRAESQRYPLHLRQFSGKKFTIPQLASLRLICRYSGLSDTAAEEAAKAQGDVCLMVLRAAGLPLTELPRWRRAVADSLFPPPIRRLPRMSYRGLVKWLKATPGARSTLQLRYVPHYSTLAKFEARLPEIEEAAKHWRRAGGSGVGIDI